MLKKLRIKFIAIIMASVAAVLVVVFAGICFSEYQRSSSNVQEALEVAVGRAAEGNRMSGPFPSAPDNAFSNRGSGSSSGVSGNPSYGSAMGAMQENRAADSNDMQRSQREQNGQGSYGGPRIGGRDQSERDLVPVAVYSLDNDGNAVVVPDYTSASISSDVLEEAVALLADKAEGHGTFPDLGLHYYKRTVQSTIYISFADTTNTSSWESLALRLGIAMLATLAAFFVIGLFLSKWALKPVSEAWDAQRQFVADASHELKTPLTVVLANTSILLKHPDTTIASQSQWIESTQVEAERMQGLVSEMLELAQVEERAVVADAPVDFSELVDAETLQFESVAFERGCMFDAVVEDGVSVTGDAGRLRKMVSTLIENALKYVDDGGTVDITLARQANQAKLAIRNTGSLIDAEDILHIFDRFYRTDKARTSDTGGFGLGLAIARETARAHGGDITCTSTEAQGTTFTVMLPLS